MKTQRSSALEQVSRIAAYGVIAILVAALLEFLLIALACAVGVVVWIAKEDFVSGFSAGLITFGAGHLLGYLVLTVWDILPEKSGERDRRDV